jgi:hypothetical protein
MATTFPAGLDNFTNPAPNDVVDSARIGNAFDAIEALQAKVGTTSSAVTSSLDYKVAINSSTIAGHIAGTAVHGATGAVMGTTNAQTVTGKSMDYAAAAPTGNTATNIPPSALASLTPNGMAARISATAFATRTLTAGSTRLTVTNGDGVAGNPTIDIPVSPSGISGADQMVTSSVTVTNATSLVVTLLANRTYIVKANLGFTGAQAGDARTVWAVTGTVTASTSRLCIGPSVNTTDVTQGNVAASTAGPIRTSRHPIATEVTYGTDGTNESAVYEEFIATGGASGGTLQLRFAQGTSSATGTILKIGSYIAAVVSA